MSLAYVALGANLADPTTQVRAALAALATLPQAQLLRASSLYRTAPVGIAHQPDFINAVAELATTLSPNDLLSALFAIESQFGRRRDYHHAPRTLDLDLLLHGDATIDEPGLRVPHPHLHERAFALLPLAEIAPEAEIPGIGMVGKLAAGMAVDGIEALP